MINETVALLGRKAEDKVTGFKGTISSVCFDLYGCVQVALTPMVDKDGKLPDGHWYDVKRLKLSDERVMAAPEFATTKFGEEIGAAEKPAPRG